ncbi:Dual specificity phosphatase, catalytic domain [Ceratobasidium sp. AG-Ba]|nr:Dual specificity phosphatase, catalytic domain [Ceratobasidium sp. AG-Ba]
MPLKVLRPITPQTNTYAYMYEITSIVPGLYLSSLSAASNAEALGALQMTHILTILDFPVEFQGWSGKRLVIKLADAVDSDLLVKFDECVQFIERAIQGGGNVLVHCNQGLSRSVTVVAAYLIARHEMRAKEALRVIEKKRGWAFEPALFDAPRLRV